MPELADESVQAVTLTPGVSTGVDTSWLGPAVVVGAAFVALAARFFWLVNKYCVNLFYSDQWHFEDGILFQKHSFVEIFAWQHGLHRQGVGSVLLALFEPLVRWNVRADAFLVAALLTMACAAALWLKVRLFGNLEYSDVAIPFLFFTPTQWGTFLGSLNPSYAPLPTLLVVLYCLAWIIRDRVRRCLLVVLLNFLLIYTGYGVLMGLLTPLLFALEYLRDRDRISAWCVLVAAASMATFFIGYRHDQTADTFAPVSASALEYLAFVTLLFSEFLQIPFTWIVPALFVGIGTAFTTVFAAGHSVACTVRRYSSISTVRLVLLSFSLAFCAATSFGRAAFGAPAPRYMSYMILAGLGIYFTALAMNNRTHRRACVLTLVLATGWGCLRISSQEHLRIEQVSEARRIWRDCYLQTHDINACDARSGAKIAWTPGLKQKLDFLERRKLNLFAE